VPIVPDQTKPSSAVPCRPATYVTKIAVVSPVITSVAPAGVPQRDGLPTPTGPNVSRDIAYTSRAAPTVEARQQPNALIVVPSVITFPTHDPTYEVPSEPSSDDEPANAATPCADVPKPIISAAVTTTK
jgi:hypothetical protein